MPLSASLPFLGTEPRACCILDKHLITDTQLTLFILRQGPSKVAQVAFELSTLLLPQPPE